MQLHPTTIQLVWTEPFKGRLGPHTEGLWPHGKPDILELGVGGPCDGGSKLATSMYLCVV